MKASIKNSNDLEKLRQQKNRNEIKIQNLLQDNEDIKLRIEQIKFMKQNQISVDDLQKEAIK